MNKLIIDNRTDITDLDAIELVRAVIKQGRISNYGRQYCYVTIIGNYSISTDLNKKSDRFVIMKNKNIDQ